MFGNMNAIPEHATSSSVEEELIPVLILDENNYAGELVNSSSARVISFSIGSLVHFTITITSKLTEYQPPRHHLYQDHGSSQIPQYCRQPPGAS